MTARFNIDLKDEPGIALLAGVLRRTGAWDRVCVTSFSGSRLRAARGLLDRPVCMATSPAVIAAVRYDGELQMPPAAKLDAASIAARTSGRSTDPPMMVNVPRQLMTGSTPSDR